MYGRDEVSAIVIDVGSYSCKAGYTGDNTPKAVFPSMLMDDQGTQVGGPADEQLHEK